MADNQRSSLRQKVLSGTARLQQELLRVVEKLEKNDKVQSVKTMKIIGASLSEPHTSRWLLPSCFARRTSFSTGVHTLQYSWYP